jgi:hypothetical protein
MECRVNEVLCMIRSRTAISALDIPLALARDNDFVNELLI